MTPAQQHRNWRPDVMQVVREIEAKFPAVECITYIDHPWPGWDGQSLDVWQDSATWTPAPRQILEVVRKYAMGRQGGPFIRHTILGHHLWTSFGGRSRWEPDDHSGGLRHLHITYW